jgi:hypothetical protein
MISLRGDLSNATTFNPPLFSLVNTVPLRKILEQDVSVTHAGHIQHVNVNKGVNKTSKSLDYFFTYYLDFIIYFFDPFCT